MVLSDGDIKKFQLLYRSELGIELSKEDAYERGIKLLSLVSAVYKPMTRTEYEAIQRHRNDTLPLLIQRLSENRQLGSLNNTDNNN